MTASDGRRDATEARAAIARGLAIRARRAAAPRSAPHWPGLAAVLLACAQGCAATPASEDPAPSGDDDASTSTSTGGGSTTFSAATPCASTEECAAAGGYCVAPFDAAAPSVALGRGPSVCVDACTEALALDRWCTDDASCCAGLLCSEVDGLCRDGDATSSSGASTWATLGDDSSSSGDVTSSSGDATTDGSSGTSSSG